MRFPPPVRLTAPLLAFVFGLLATWFDYRLNLDLDLARHLQEMRNRAESSGRRLAEDGGRLIASGDVATLQAEVATIPDIPDVETVGVVDGAGLVIADSTGRFRGQRAESTPLAPAAALINPAAKPVVSHQEAERAVLSAHPFRIGENQTGWALLVFDRIEAIEFARSDARTQLSWMASAMALLAFSLWAVLHFGFTARLARLTESVRAYGEGKIDCPVGLRGGDEVSELSGAFISMAAKLHERESEQLRLEGELLEVSEGERRRIGHDLHDGIGQRLTAASLATQAAVTLLTRDAPEHAGRVAAIGGQIRETIAELRTLSHGLAPVAVAEDGLANALAALAESTAASGAVRCVFECPEPVRVTDEGIAGHLYRIAQEAVTNALKHARSSEIRIGLECRLGEAVLEVDDDGDGFDESSLRKPGIGLRVMRYRAQLIGGRLDVIAAPAGGTRIACHVRLPT